jgi:hypothetical protein
VPRIARHRLSSGLARVEAAVGPNEKGRALEDFFCDLFPLVPGIEIAERNVLNVFQTEEIDVAMWNAKHARGFYFLPNLVLVECKNWSHACGSAEVAYFVNLLRNRGCDHGILFAANGITGAPEELTRAHFEMATALAAGIRVIVLTPTDVRSLKDTRQLVDLFKRKLCQLVVSGTNFL